MKILFITDLIPIEEKENCAKALIPIIKELMLHNDVEIIRPNFLLNSKIRGKSFLPNGIYECNGLKINNKNFLTPFWGRIDDIDISSYDKIIAHMPSGILYAEALLSKFPEPKPQTTYAVHQSDIQVMTSSKYAFYFRKAMKNAYKNCDKILCRSPHLKEKLLKIMPDCEAKTEINPIKVPLKYFISDEEMFAKIKAFEGIRFVSAANMIKRKNIDIIIKSFANFIDKDFTLEIIGDGKELPKLQKLTKKYNLQDKIIFTGKLPHDEVLEHFKKANVFVLPSTNETLGLVYLEASASGCLCIGTKNTGIDGIFQDNINCFLCDPTVNGLTKILDKVFKLTTEDFKNLLENRKIAEIV